MSSPLDEDGAGKATVDFFFLEGFFFFFLSSVSGLKLVLQIADTAKHSDSSLASCSLKPCASS